MRRWDPTWRGEDVYYLATGDLVKKFFMTGASLFCNDKRIDIAAPGRLCAGSFDDRYYYGSCSIDVKMPDRLDQLIFVCDDEWNIISRYRPSEHLEQNEMFSMREVFPFRDPCPMPDGRIAVVTGGKRWGTTGNICAVKFDGDISLESETILHKSLRAKFKEIERPTFYEDWMFISAGGALSKDVSPIYVAKLMDGYYRYHSEVENSNGCYGMSLRDGCYATYWLRDRYKIVIPQQPNLHYSTNRWCLTNTV